MNPRNRPGTLSMSTAMRLTASDFASYHRPTRCDLRVFLRHQREQEARAFADSPRDIGHMLTRHRSHTKVWFKL
jgi:hypothetical protein